MPTQANFFSIELDPERVLDLLLDGVLRELLVHQNCELGEVKLSVVVDVDLSHEVEDLLLGGIAAQRAHQLSQLFAIEETIAALVVELEGLLHLEDEVQGDVLVQQTHEDAALLGLDSIRKHSIAVFASRTA